MGRVVVGLAVAIMAAAGLGQEFKLGSQVGDFTLQDVKGAPVSLEKLKGEVTVIAFIATQCPISNDYNERMKALYRDYAGRGVRFIFINSNHTEPAAEVEEHAQRNGFPFPVYKDHHNVVADRFGAQFTPEVFVLDRGGVMRYHGAIDDARAAERVKAHHLRMALDDMLAGRSVASAETRAFGCTIKRAKKAS